MSTGKKIAIIGLASLGAYGLFRFSRRTSNLSGKFKINPIVPNRISLDGFAVTINFPFEVINQSSVNVTLRNLVFNVAYQDAGGHWSDLLIQRRVINEVNFPPGKPMVLGEIPLTIGLGSIGPIMQIIRGQLPGKLLVTTRFDVAGIEIEPIEEIIDAAKYLQPISNWLKGRGLVNGLDAEYGKPGYKPGLPVFGFGYSSNSIHHRTIKDASRYAHLMPLPLGKETEIRVDGSAYDTIDDMKKIVESTLWQTEKLAQELKGSTREQTVKNIFWWLHDHIQYNQDAQGIEQLREPAVSFAHRKTGIDCDCFAIFASSLLLNSGIDHHIQMCKIAPDDWFKHVYVVVPKQANQSISSRNNYWVVDPCLHQFDQMAPKVTQTYSQIMRTTHLSGLDASCKCTNPSNFQNGKFGKQVIVTGNQTGKTALPVSAEKHKINQLALQALEPMRQQLLKTRAEVKNNPGSVALLYKPDALVQSIEYVLMYWNDPEKRQQALDILAKKDNEIANVTALKGLHGLQGTGINPIYSYPIIGFDGLGNAHTVQLGGLFQSMAQGAKNVTQTISNASKKVTDATRNAVKTTVQAVANNVQKINPVMVTARTAYRGLVALNFRGQATKMANALTTRDGEEKLRNFWTSNLIGGNMADLISAINAGKGKKAILGGTGLGEPVTIATSVAAATPVLIAIEKVLDSIKTAQDTIKPVTDSISKVQTIVNDGKAAYSSITNLIPNKSNPGSSVLVSPPNSDGFVNPDPGIRTNDPVNSGKSNTGLFVGLGVLAAAIIAFVATSGGSKKSLSGVPSITI
jgi:hypothetical protein